MIGLNFVDFFCTGDKINVKLSFNLLGNYLDFDLLVTNIIHDDDDDDDDHIYFVGSP